MSTASSIHIRHITSRLLTRSQGQFYDVLHLYSLTGEPSDKHLVLMNGDLVDRGSWSIEVILLALTYKCMLSSFFFHDVADNMSRAISKIYVHKPR